MVVGDGGDEVGWCNWLWAHALRPATQRAGRVRRRVEKDGGGKSGVVAVVLEAVVIIVVVEMVGCGGRP